MVKTRAQRSQSTFNTPSPIALPVRTKKRKSIAKPTNLEVSEDVKDTDETRTEKLQTNTTPKKSQKITSPKKSQKITTPKKSARKEKTPTKPKTGEKVKTPGQSGKKKNIKIEKLQQESESSGDDDETVKEQDDRMKSVENLDSDSDSDDSDDEAVKEPENKVKSDGNLDSDSESDSDDSDGEEKEESPKKTKSKDAIDDMLSKKTEGNVKTGTVKSENDVPMDTDTESSSSSSEDDDAPEDVSFHQSRHDALEMMSQAMQETKKLRDKEKEKRKARDELFVLQKKQKLQDARLPEGFIQEVKKEQEMVEEENKLLQKGSKKQHSHHDDDDDDDVESDKKDTNAAGMEVISLQKQMKKPKPKSQTAIDFLKQRLWGSDIKRQSANELYAKANKKHGKPAFKFSSKKGLPKKKKKKPKQDQRSWSSLI